MTDAEITEKLAQHQAAMRRVGMDERHLAALCRAAGIIDMITDQSMYWRIPHIIEEWEKINGRI